MAVDTIVRLFHTGRMIAFTVELLGKFQHIPGAEFNTIPTPFAAVLQNMNDSGGNLDILCIKRNPPEQCPPLSEQPLERLTIRFIKRSKYTRSQVHVKGKNGRGMWTIKRPTVFQGGYRKGFRVTRLHILIVEQPGHDPPIE